MLRAVGMRRGRLVRGFIIEGAVYALVASALGLVAGLGVGRAVVEVTARIFAGFAPEDGGLDLVYTVTPTSLVNGFAAGFLIGFLTVALTSIRISRINIIAAIRDLPAGGRPPPQVALGAGLDPGRGRVRGRGGGRHRRQPGRRHLPVPGPGRGRPLPAAGPPAAEAGRVHRGVAGRARLGAGRQHGPAQGVRRRLHRHLHRPRRGADLLGGAAGLPEPGAAAAPAAAAARALVRRPAWRPGWPSPTRWPGASAPARR